MFALSVTICEKSAIEMCMTLIFEWVNVKYKYAKGKISYDFLFVSNSNVCPICNRLQDINSRIIHDLDLDF